MGEKGPSALHAIDYGIQQPVEYTSATAVCHFNLKYSHAKQIKIIEKELDTTKIDLAKSIRELEEVKESQSTTKSGNLFKVRSCNDIVKEEAIKEAEKTHAKLVTCLASLKSRLKTARKGQDRIQKEVPQLSQISTLRHDLERVIATIFFLDPSSEESYFSKQLDKLVQEFFEAHKQSIDLKTASENVQRGIRLLKNDNGVIYSQKEVDLVALEDIIFALHFLQLANTFWPNLRHIELPKSFDIGCRGKGSQRENWALASQRLRILKDHLNETFEFLKKEQMANIDSLNSVFSKCMEVSETLRLVRFKMLEARIAAVPGLASMSERRLITDSQWGQMLAVDIEHMKKIALIQIVAKSHEEIGRAVGQIYLSTEELDVEFKPNQTKDTPPSYDEKGGRGSTLVKLEQFTIVVEAPSEESRVSSSTLGSPRVTSLYEMQTGSRDDHSMIPST
ncbi:UNVERIFIED_CONTAM: hypothetical protein HDU68_004062 [Siphonaria sp. JEL0065]|nr:hypothetical protein HDU68_004062 [Siphonaria sp. JEL0065]